MRKILHYHQIPTSSVSLHFRASTYITLLFLQGLLQVLKIYPFNAWYDLQKKIFSWKFECSVRSITNLATNLPDNGMVSHEPGQSKSYKICAPSGTSEQPSNMGSLITVFAGHSRGSQRIKRFFMRTVKTYQAVQIWGLVCLCWVHMPFLGFTMPQLIL